MQQQICQELPPEFLRFFPVLEGGGVVEPLARLPPARSEFRCSCTEPLVCAAAALLVLASVDFARAIPVMIAFTENLQLDKYMYIGS